MNKKKLLSRQQLGRLAASFRRVNVGEADSTQLVRFQCIVSWAEDVVTQAALLEAVLNGMLDINWTADEVMFVESKPYKKGRPS